MRILRYSLLRLAVLAGVVAILYLIGMRSWLLALASVLIAALVSYIALPGSRLRAAQEVAEHVPGREGTRPRRPGRVSARARQDAADEDAEIDG